jgi:hypothetical protein
MRVPVFEEAEKVVRFIERGLKEERCALSERSHDFGAKPIAVRFFLEILSPCARVSVGGIALLATTLSDVARRAGVSTATVSLVLRRTLSIQSVPNRFGLQNA